MQTTDADAAVYAEFASRHRAQAGDLEVDDNAPVNPSADDGQHVQGAYVQAWIYVSNDAIAFNMARRLEEAGVSCEDLDDLVHDTAEKSIAAGTDNADEDLAAQTTLASNANNGGLPDQCLFLIERLGAGTAHAQIESLIGERSQQRVRPSETA